MAYRIPNKNPLDLNLRKGIGVALPFDGDAVFISTLTTSNQIKYNLINFILTSPGERLYNTTFGSSLKGYIFEALTNDTLKELEQTVIREVNQEFGAAINIQQFTITPIFDANSISAIMVFNTPFGPTDVINFNL